MNERKLTAKEQAWLREKQKLKHDIRVLEHNLKEKDAEISELKETVSKIEDENRQYQDWIERLHQYMDMPEKEMREIIKHQKDLNNLFNGFDALLNFLKIGRKID